MGSDKCTKCGGRKHVPDDKGNWIKCDQCYASTAAEHRLSKLPEHMRNVGLADITQPKLQNAKANLGRIIEILASGGWPKKFVIISGTTSKDTLVAATIRDAALQEVAAERASLQHCVDSYFGDKPEWGRLLAQTKFLLLHLGTEIPNAAAAPVLREAVGERRWGGRYTVVLSELSVEAMSRSARYPDEVADFLASDEFKEVKV